VIQPLERFFSAIFHEPIEGIHILVNYSQVHCSVAQRIHSIHKIIDGLKCVLRIEKLSAQQPLRNLTPMASLHDRNSFGVLASA
jgi:hypothetical protein